MLVAVVACLEVSSSYAQPAPRTDAIAFVHKFMAAVQPELMMPKNIVRVTEESHVSVYKPFSAEYLVTIKNFFAPEGYNGSGPPRFAMPWRPPDETYLKASVRMMRSVFVEYGGWPDAVRAKRDEYDRQVKAHPEWSDDDAVRALTELGAKFGPGTEGELRKRLPLTQLSALLGKVRVTGEPELRLRLPQGGDGEPRHYLGMASWGLSIGVTAPGKAERIYQVIVEPFEGRIVDIFTSDYRPF